MTFIWTITKNPSDAVEQQKQLGLADVDIFVLRPHVVGEGWTTPLAWCKASTSLEELQARLREKGLNCIPRSPGDDPVIVECWL